MLALNLSVLFEPEFTSVSQIGKTNTKPTEQNFPKNQNKTHTIEGVTTPFNDSGVRLVGSASFYRKWNGMDAYD